MPDPIPYRPLGILRTALESLGFHATHCYEDLIFIEHNAFLLRMEQKGEEVSLFFNADSEPDKRAGIAEALQSAGSRYRLTIAPKGTYRLTPNEMDSNSLDIELIEDH